MAVAESVDGIEPITRRTDAAEVALAVYRQLLDVLEKLSPPAWAAPTECPDWNVDDTVGHMIGAARANASFRENLRQQIWGVRNRREYGGNPLDAANALQIADCRTLGPAAKLNALRDVAPAAVDGRMRMPALMRAVTVPLASNGSTASGMPRSVNVGHLVDVIYTRDAWMHTVDIARATDHPLDLSGPVNRRLIADVVAEWARRHKQPFDLLLTGPAGGRYRTTSGTTTATSLEMDAVEFGRILSGRADGDGLLATRVVF